MTLACADHTQTEQSSKTTRQMSSGDVIYWTKVQRMSALEKANAKRFERAKIKRQVKNGEISFEDLLDDVPEAVSSVPVLTVLKWLPKVGPTKARRMFYQALDRSEFATIGALTVRERRALYSVVAERLF